MLAAVRSGQVKTDGSPPVVAIVLSGHSEPEMYKSAMISLPDGVTVTSPLRTETTWDPIEDVMDDRPAEGEASRRAAHKTSM